MDGERFAQDGGGAGWGGAGSLSERDAAAGFVGASRPTGRARFRQCFRWSDEVKLSLLHHLYDLEHAYGPAISRYGQELAQRVSVDVGYSVTFRSLRNLRYNLPQRIKEDKESQAVVDAYRSLERLTRSQDPDGDAFPAPPPEYATGGAPAPGTSGV